MRNLLAESGVSNGSLYHHFPGGMEEVAEAALDASGAFVAEALREALDAAPSAGEGIVRFLDVVGGQTPEEQCAGCPIAPTALESPIISPHLRAAAARCFDEQEDLIAARLRADGWPDGSAQEAASATLALIEGALLLARVERATESPRSRHALRSCYSPRQIRGPRHSNVDVLTRGAQMLQ